MQTETETETETETDTEIVVVGGGIAGLSLASALARDGRAVTVLEATLEYEDRVRGESMVPWGVAEAKDLGVLPTLLDAGARTSETWVHYDELVPTEISLANRIPAGMMLPGIPGSLNLRHPEACTALAKQATHNGAHVLRGVSGVEVRAGGRPTVRAVVAGEALELQPRLVVGADGRASTVRRQVGIQLERQPVSHMIAGLLVDGLDDVDLDHDFLATTDDLFMASFRQHPGQIRVYLCPGLRQKDRFAGPGGVAEFLRSSAFPCLPFGEQLAAGRPSGPLATYPGDDTWTPEPYVPGVVLMGDAAGYNSPIIGQGLSIALRDARIVRDTIRSGDLSPAGFAAYGAERTERMRRLRSAATFMASVATDDCDTSKARRAAFFDLQQHEPLMMGLLGAMYAGPEQGPAEAFDGRLHERILAA